MATEVTFHTLFWILMGILAAIRLMSVVKVQQAGERVMPDRAAIEREGRAMFALRVIAFIYLLAALVLYAVNPPWMALFLIPLPGWLRWAGFGLGLASLALLGWTQMTLGRHWSPQLQLRERHHLVTIGPYARVRHPLYTATLGIGTAFALLSAHWLFTLPALVAIVGLVLRTDQEERMMIEAFGDEYRNYMRMTGRFLPRF